MNPNEMAQLAFAIGWISGAACFAVTYLLGIYIVKRMKDD